MRRENKYWLMSNVPHVSRTREFQNKTEWGVYVSFEKNLNEGDILYLADAEKGIYAWGYLTEIAQHQSTEQTSIKISRGAIKSPLIDKREIQQIKDISDLLLFRGGSFTFLTNKQVKILNSLIPYGVSKPPLPRNQQFIINQPVEDEEDLYTEFKQINVNKIPDIAYDYAPSFLNQEGGRIYFGIRDNDKSVIGINVEYSQKDQIQQKVENKLSSIKPPIHPVEHYSLGFHQVIDAEGKPIPDCYVFELEIKPSASKNYTSATGKYSIKTFSGKQII